MQICILAVASLCTPFVGAQSTYGRNSLPTIKDSEIVAQAFPDIEVELLSPAFLENATIPPGWLNGTRGPTDDAQLDNFLRRLAERNDWMSYQSATFSSEEGRPVPYVYLSSSSQNSRDRNVTKLKVYIQAAIHGNEPSADQAAMALLGKMDANQTWTASILEKMDVKILPRYNSDGVAYYQRQLASNLDPNREHLKLARQQSRDIKRAFNDYSPHISIDLHEYTANRVFGGDYLHGADALISGGINPNIRQEIRDQLLDVFIPAMGAHLESNGLRWEPYVTGTPNSTRGSRIELEEAVTEARTGRNAYGLTQTISFLLETRGIGIADQHFRRRVATQLLKLEAILETARDQFDDVYLAVENARQEFINANDDIVITDYYTLTNRTFTMVNRNTGQVEQVPVDFWETTPSVANITRPRPEAYLIPRTWSDVAARLENSGLQVETLDHEYHGSVEFLNITSHDLAGSLYEGVVLNTVTTEALDKEVHLPTGSFWVSTRQKNAALAFIALEPENIDSYVTFSLIPVETGDEYSVYRIMDA